MNVWKKLPLGKSARVILACVGALLLLVLVKVAFFDEEGELSADMTEEESRICAILTEMEGVDDAELLITRFQNGEVSAVVVYKGEDSLLTRVQIADVVGSVLQAEQKDVRVYLAQSK